MDSLLCRMNGGRFCSVHHLFPDGFRVVFAGNELGKECSQTLQGLLTLDSLVQGEFRLSGRNQLERSRCRVVLLFGGLSCPPAPQTLTVFKNKPRLSTMIHEPNLKCSVHDSV